MGWLTKLNISDTLQDSLSNVQCPRYARSKIYLFPVVISYKRNGPIISFLLSITQYTIILWLSRIIVGEARFEPCTSASAHLLSHHRIACFRLSQILYFATRRNIRQDSKYNQGANLWEARMVICERRGWLFVRGEDGCSFVVNWDMFHHNSRLFRLINFPEQKTRTKPDNGLSPSIWIAFWNELCASMIIE